MRTVLTGRAADALRQLGDPTDREVFLAGPPDMLHTCLDTLAELGLPNERIHYDIVSA